ncbi:MAG: tetratricopeptide repeat protein [Chlorobiaceae bacterium]|nr:tetratricopeptide repeat protein [Chlorobiaceae bacterium]
MDPCFLQPETLQLENPLPGKPDSSSQGMRFIKFYVCLLSILFAALVITESKVTAKTPSEVFKLVSKSVVVIKSYDDRDKLLTSGSGIVIEKSSDVVTNYHVIERAARIVVLYNNREYNATLRHVDQIRDICSLSVPGLNAVPVSLGTASSIEIGATVYAIGFPMGVGLTFSDGIVSCLRETSGGNYIQFTAPISSGSSGGGLFDEQGKLIGIPTYFVSQGQLLNFALPVEWVIDLPNRISDKSFDHKKENKSENDYQRKAAAMEEKEDWVAQIALCERWTKEFPASMRSWELLGAAYANNGDLNKAIEAYRQAVMINQDSMQTWLELGLLYGKTGQVEKQVDAYRKAVRINHDYAGAWYKLAIVYRDTDQFSNALEASKQVVRINPSHLSTWMVLGYLYGRLGQYDQQIDAYLQALHLNRYSADAYVCLGIAYKNAHREEEEKEAFHQALRLKPDNPIALFNLAHDYMQHGEKEKGMEYYSRLQAIDPEIAKLFFNDLNYRMDCRTGRKN